jgi:peroxiredoxin
MIYMKINFCVISLFLAITPGYYLRAQNTGYQIDAHIAGLQKGEKVVFKLFGKPWENFRIDSTMVMNEKFQFSGKVQDGPRMYALGFEKHPNHAIYLYINNGDMINIKVPDINKMESGRIQDRIYITGSPSSLGAQALSSAFYLYSQMVMRISKEMKRLIDSIGFEPGQIGQWMAAKRNLVDALNFSVIRPNVKNKGLMLMLNQYNDQINHAYFLPEVCARVDKEMLDSYYGKILQQRAALASGQSFPDFSLPDIDDTIIHSKNVISKNKITLIHFWANTSFEREAFQAELRSVYKKYGNLGFGIVGVSSDTSRKEWKVRVQVEEYPWINVSDLKGKDGVVEKVYHEYNTYNVRGTNNTTNVLVNREGKIIAWDVYGAELQWYLWNYLETGK